MMPILTVSDLRKSFGGVTAVDGIRFDVHRGTILAIIGPNGAGKTTVFNILTGFLRADHGSVRHDGVEVLGLRPYELAERGLARSFQLVRPFLGMTVTETLAVSAQGRRIRRRYPDAREVRDRHDALLRQVRLDGVRDTLVDALNQGELRLLDVARALATDPDVVFLDEPFSGLGHAHIELLSRLLLDLRGKGVAVVIIEHRLRETMGLVDRVMVMNFGRKLAEALPAEIVRDPAVVEAYLGSRGKDLVAS